MASRYAFAAMCFIYAFFGSPTPDNPGLVEIAIAVLLIVSIGWKGAQTCFDCKDVRTIKYEQVYLFFGLSIPLVVATFYANISVFIFRDTVGFLFLLLPVFLMTVVRNNKRAHQFLLYSALLIASIFALRTLYPAFPFFLQTEELLYLSNSPLVLFSFIFLMGKSLELMSLRVSLKNIYVSSFLLFFAFIMLFSMLQEVQRAPIVAGFVSFALLYFWTFLEAPKKLILPTLLIGIVVTLSASYFDHIAQSIIHKTYSVGFNMRFQELSAVWRAVNDNIFTMIFGLGWGATFESPAVGGLSVSYSHSLLSYMLLKTGLLGLFLTLLYLFIFLRRNIALLFANRVVGIALLWAFLIPVFLYASYKSLDYGLLLAVIMAFSSLRQEAINNKSESRTLSVYA